MLRSCGTCGESEVVVRRHVWRVWLGAEITVVFELSWVEHGPQNHGPTEVEGPELDYPSSVPQVTGPSSGHV